MDDLRRQGLKVIEAGNKQMKNQIAIKYVFTNLQPGRKHQQNIWYNILGCKVEIQPLIKNKFTPQCKKCQAYGHTQFAGKHKAFNNRLQEIQKCTAKMCAL